MKLTGIIFVVLAIVVSLAGLGARGAWADGRFEYTEYNTIIDHQTGLEWQLSHHIAKPLPTDPVAYCEDLVQGEHDDWRLPEIYELFTMADWKTGHSFEKVFKLHWTYPSITLGRIDGVSRRLTFGGDNSLSYYWRSHGVIRCVRGEPLPKPDIEANFQPYTEHTVLDTASGVIWAKPYREGRFNEKNQEYQGLKYKVAVHYCENLVLDGLTGWRIPTFKEAWATIDPLVPTSVIERSIPKRAQPIAFWTSDSDFFRDSKKHVMYLNGIGSYLDENQYYIPSAPWPLGAASCVKDLP